MYGNQRVKETVEEACSDVKAASPLTGDEFPATILHSKSKKTFFPIVDTASDVLITLTIYGLDDYN